MEFNPFGGSRIQRETRPGRVPPGQTVTKKFPELHVGAVPAFDPSAWDFRVYGEVGQPLVFSYDQFMQLPTVVRLSDFHCVTGWSKLDNEWEGVSFLELMRMADLKSVARYVVVHAEGEYTTNAPLEDMMSEDVLLAYRHNSANLSPEHGWPLRLVVPSLYAYKSAKWLRALELTVEDRPGYWEVRGYHNRGDPWKEERYAL